MFFAFGSNLPPEELGWVLGTAAVVGMTEAVGATEVEAVEVSTDDAVEVSTDEAVLVVGTIGEDTPPSVDSEINTPPLVVEELNGIVGLLEGPAALEVGIGGADTGVNGEESGVTDTGNLLPVPIGALMTTVVGSGEADGAVFLMAESNHEDNQRS